MRTLVQRFLFAVLCTVLSTVALHSTSYAKECEGGNCKSVKVYNFTGVEYSLHFLLCCDGEYRETRCYTIPPEGRSIDFPDGCTVVKFAFCSSAHREPCLKWDETECYIKIVYCTQ
jgi:hypothetical protein